MNLGQARQELADRGFDYLPASRLDLMLNRARNDFEDYWPWPWLRTYLLGVPAPVDISDLKYVTSVAIPGERELLGLEDSDVNRLDVATVNGSLPGYWYLLPQAGSSEGVTMHTWPESQAPLNVIYVRTTSELDSQNTDDTPEIPARYHLIWIDYAVVQGYKDSDNFPAAQALQADISVRMQKLVERYETRNRQHGRLMSIRFGSDDD